MGKKIPRAVSVFLLKAVLLFIIWKLTYIFLLLPGRVLDRPLTRAIGIFTAAGLNVFAGADDYRTVEEEDNFVIDGKLYHATSMDIRRNGMQTLRVADACNGLELMVLYSGYLLCIPSAVRRKFLFITGGCLLICLLNVLRCMGLVYIFIHYNKLLDFSHHFAFTFIIYAFIFLLWYIYSKNLRMHVRTAQD